MYDYDCEIEGCTNKTEGYLCDYHLKEALLDKEVVITICDTCLKILKIEKKPGYDGDRYVIAKDCMRCRPIDQIDPLEPFDPPTPLPE